MHLGSSLRFDVLNGAPPTSVFFARVVPLGARQLSITRSEAVKVLPTMLVCCMTPIYALYNNFRCSFLCCASNGGPSLREPH